MKKEERKRERISKREEGRKNIIEGNGGTEGFKLAKSAVGN